jgi:hypothetical protein
VSGNHNEDSRRPQESWKRAASIGSEHPSRVLTRCPEGACARHKTGSSLSRMQLVISGARDQLRHQLRSRHQLRHQPQLTTCTIASYHCVCVHLVRTGDRVPHVYLFGNNGASDVDIKKQVHSGLCGSDSTRCVRKERIHTTSMERKKATGSPCGCARARPAFAQSSSTHVITAHTKERCAFPCARPCPSPASSTCRPPPPPTPILPPPNLLTRPASHTCRVPGLPYQGRLRSGRRGLPY